MPQLTKALVAELLGTFALIFLGAGGATIVGLNTIPSNLVTVMFAHVFAIIFLIYAFGHISGTHINPAVTIALTVAGKFEPYKVLPYIGAQLVGAILGGFALLYVFGGPVNRLGATVVDYEITTLGGAFFLEVAGTFLLVTTILNAAVSGRAGNFAPIAIGFTVGACIVFFGPLTGASLNPARTIGPAVATGIYLDFWMYMVSTILGGVLAALLYRYFLEDPAQLQPPETRTTAAGPQQPSNRRSESSRSGRRRSAS